MSHVVSLIGPPAVGKTTFAQWFVHRNPIYVHLDVAQYRQWFNINQRGIDNEERIKREEKAWEAIERAISQAGYAIIESTGLSHRLRNVVESADSSCAIKLLANPADLTSRIIKRNSSSSDLELMYLEHDIFEIQRLKVDLVGENLSILNYPQLEEQIFLFMLERCNTNLTIGENNDSSR
jgi:hypothetical protein